MENKYRIKTGDGGVHFFALRKRSEKFIIFFFVAFLLISFSPDRSQDIEDLREKVSANIDLFGQNIDEAYLELPKLLNQAIQLRDTSSILQLQELKCRYYYAKTNVEKLFDATKEYEEEANRFHSVKDLAISHIFTAEAYSFTELFNKSIIELDKAWKIVEDDSVHDLDNVDVRVNILTSYANIYLQQNKPQEAIGNLTKINEVVKNIGDEARIKNYKYKNYSNLSSIYTLFDMDSAKYYAEISSGILPQDLREPTIEAQNKFVIGRYYELNDQDSVALDYYLNAYNILKDNGEALNSKALYLSILNIARKFDDTEKIEKFEALLQEVENNLLQAKYNSINQMLDIHEPKPSFMKTAIWLTSISILILLGYFFLYRWKRESETAPEVVIDSDSYDNLLKMAQSDDPSFMNAFEQLYPDFTKKLLKINPKLSRTEIEFCALLKLNQSTKQISLLKYIEIRTVQNKKYRIRKRLNIPEATDIYNWFELV